MTSRKLVKLLITESCPELLKSRALDLVNSLSEDEDEDDGTDDEVSDEDRDETWADENTEEEESD